MECASDHRGRRSLLHLVRGHVLATYRCSRGPFGGVPR